MTTNIKRATGLLVIEVVNSNPNGDPDRESDPRQRPNGLGEISPVSFKRKLRELVANSGGPFFDSLPEKFLQNKDHYQILESRGREYAVIRKEMGEDPDNFLNSEFVKKYWDARVFGNTILEKGKNEAADKDTSDNKGKGKKANRDKEFIKSGVVQFGVGVSIAPIHILRHTNTNKSGVQEGKNAGMAPLAFRIVEHGVYCMPFFVNPNYANKTGCTADDIELMKLLIPQAYDLNRSAIRPDVRIRHAWYIEHKNALGSCPDYMLLEALTPKRLGNDRMEPSTSWKDYEDKTKASVPDDIKNKVDDITDLMNP